MAAVAAGNFRRGIDEDTLKQVADMTGGTYYSAESAGELESVFAGLPTYLITKHETTEIGAFFVAAAVLLAGGGLLLPASGGRCPDRSARRAGSRARRRHERSGLSLHRLEGGAVDAEVHDPFAGILDEVRRHVVLVLVEHALRRPAARRSRPP